MQLGAVSGKGNRWLARHYGSRSGFVRTYWYRLLYYLGAYRRYKNVDWQSIERLIFVCKGNICRSAYAEVVARSLGVDAISCGLDTIEDAPANKGAKLAAKNHGFDLEEHKTKPVMYLVLKKTDLIVTMEPWQAVFLNKNLMRTHQITLLGLWGNPELPHIQDPYGAEDAYFDSCFYYIQASVKTLVKNLVSNVGVKSKNKT